MTFIPADLNSDSAESLPQYHSKVVISSVTVYTFGKYNQTNMTTLQM